VLKSPTATRATAREVGQCRRTVSTLSRGSETADEKVSFLGGEEPPKEKALPPGKRESEDAGFLGGAF